MAQQGEPFSISSSIQEATYLEKRNPDGLVILADFICLYVRVCSSPSYNITKEKVQNLA